MRRNVTFWIYWISACYLLIEKWGLYATFLLASSIQGCLQFDEMQSKLNSWFLLPTSFSKLLGLGYLITCHAYLIPLKVLTKNTGTQFRKFCIARKRTESNDLRKLWCYLKLILFVCVSEWKVWLIKVEPVYRYLSKSIEGHFLEHITWLLGIFPRCMWQSYYIRRPEAGMLFCSPKKFVLKCRILSFWKCHFSHSLNTFVW